MGLKLDGRADLTMGPFAFLALVYSLCAEGKPRHALEVVFDWVDDRLLACHFGAVREALEAADLERLAPTCRLGFWSVCQPYKEHPEIAAALFEYARRVQAWESAENSRVKTLLGFGGGTRE